MSDIEFVPLTAALLHQVLPQAESIVGAYAQGEAAARLTLGAPPDWRFCMKLAGRPVLAFGLWPLWPGRAEAWLLHVQDLPAAEIVRGTNESRDRLHDGQAKLPELRRVEMWVRADASWRETFARRLGMQMEGLACGWGPDGSDYALFARVVTP